MAHLTAEQMRAAFGALDEILERPVRLVIGGSGAMILTHGARERTAVVDAISIGASAIELEPLVRRIAKELGISADWLNSYYGTFAHVLPEGYSTRLRRVFDGAHLTADALGFEDLLIMKCLARRGKDVAHARALLRLKPDLDLVSSHIEALQQRGVPGATEALDFLDDLEE